MNEVVLYVQVCSLTVLLPHISITKPPTTTLLRKTDQQLQISSPTPEEETKTLKMSPEIPLFLVTPSCSVTVHSSSYGAKKACRNLWLLCGPARTQANCDL